MSIRHWMVTSNHWSARFGVKMYRRCQQFTLPTPRVITLPILFIFLFLRTVYYFLVRVLICEPLFKAYCTSYGRRLRTGVYVHWVMGKGRIIVGDDVVVDGKCSFVFATRYCENPTLEIGHHTYIRHRSAFTIGERITIGNYCRIAGGVRILDSPGHPTDPNDRKAGMPAPRDRVRAVNIEDNVWIGTNATILPGVTIGANSVVAMESVVTKDVPANTVVAGNPARVVRQLKPEID